LSRIGALARGTTGLELPSMAESEAEPVDRGTVKVRHRLMHEARLGIDIGCVLMRIRDVRNPERCGFRPGAEDWVAMMMGSLGDTNVHIISRVGGSGTERRLKDFLRSSGFMARTGFLADNVDFCRTRSGMRGKGMVFRHLNSTHFLDDRVECLTDINTQTQGSAMLLLIPTMYANGRAARFGHHRTES